MTKGNFYTSIVRHYKSGRNIFELAEVSGWIDGTIGYHKDAYDNWIATDIATGCCVSSAHSTRKGAQKEIAERMDELIEARDGNRYKWMLNGFAEALKGQVA